MILLPLPVIRAIAAGSARRAPHQLSEYMAGKNGLSETQVRWCEEVLLATAREKSQVIARLLEPKIAAYGD